jgi:hypothetical protein
MRAGSARVPPAAVEAREAPGAVAVTAPAVTGERASGVATAVVTRASAIVAVDATVGRGRTARPLDASERVVGGIRLTIGSVSTLPVPAIPQEPRSGVRRL